MKGRFFIVVGRPRGNCYSLRMMRSPARSSSVNCRRASTQSDGGGGIASINGTGAFKVPFMEIAGRDAAVRFSSTSMIGSTRFGAAVFFLLVSLTTQAQRALVGRHRQKRAGGR
jgi:hypothetical protein